MPANVIPVAELLRDFVQQALGEDRKTADHIPVSHALRWFTEGYREIVRRTQFMIATINLNTLSITGITDILDHLIPYPGALWCQNPQGEWYSLILRERQYIFEKYLNGSIIGPPVDWIWDDLNPFGGIQIYPVPTASTVLFLDYVQDPGSLTRLYDDDVALCAVTNGSIDVTFAGSITGRVAAQDVFGIKATAEELPATWYGVKYVIDTTHIQLAEAYSGPTDPAALFTLSQVSPCEWRRPNLVSFGPVAFALFKYWEREDQARAVEYQQIWQSEISRIATAASERPGLTLRRRNITKSYPGMRSR